MARTAEQLEWLSLIDVSGPFLAPVVLEDVFPQGLDRIDTPRRQRLRMAYEEWRDAVDDNDPELSLIHGAWVDMVLKEGLEYEDQVLIPRERLESLACRSLEHDERFAPDFAVKTDGGTFMLLVSVHPPEADLDKALPIGRSPLSPVERMALMCRANGVRVGLVTNGEEWALVNAPVGGTSGVATWYARLWWQEPTTLQAFVSLLGVRRAFGPAPGALGNLLDRSTAFQQEVTDTLGDQVRRAVEVLVQALGRADQDRNGVLLADVNPVALYEAGLTVMMRLVFLLCAEERGLLLLGDPIYDECYAISTLRSQLRDEESRHGPEVLERRHDAWSRLLSVFRAVYGGVEHEALRMPALGGSLFDPDRFPFLEGRGRGTAWRTAPAAPLLVDNRTVLLLLTSLQVLERPSGAQLLSYRALDVEQIGHVYEGLLEYTVVKVSDTTVGLLGSQQIPHPTMTLADLEALAGEGRTVLAERLARVTGRSESAIGSGLSRPAEPDLLLRLMHVVGGDQDLSRRLHPFAALIRTDRWGAPLVYRAGAFAIERTTERRETGTHYTPRALAEMIVERTLEPIVYSGPAEGRSREEWTLKGPADLLALKICDPAMGSGAFLVQACRYLAARLIDAWASVESDGHAVSIDGVVHESLGDEEPLPAGLDDRMLLARRLVAERCLFGVDINPLAVELAKLSLWLVTLAKGRPFGFLDHDLRCGDTLLGIAGLRELAELRLDSASRAHQTRLFGTSLKTAVDEAIDLRRRLTAIPVRDIRDIDAMARLDAQSRSAVGDTLLFADAMIGAMLRAGGDRKAATAALDGLALKADGFFGGDGATKGALAIETAEALSIGLAPGRSTRRPFHWPLEFPEVFARENPGFDAIVGNPPFLGNRLWKPSLGPLMQWQAELLLGAKPGKVDLCLLFHRRAVELIRRSGTYGLLATSNIAEGSAIPFGLGQIVSQGDIVFASKGMPWPGTAAVLVAVVCFFKGPFAGLKEADGVPCDRIGPRLEAEKLDQWIPRRLDDPLFSFEGVNNSQGLAFVLHADDPWAERLRAEGDSLLRPYITGDDITSTALISPKRYALDIADYPLEDIRTHHPIAYAFLDEVVKSTRTPESLKSYKGLDARWWQFWNNRAGLMRRLRKHERCIVFSKVTKHPICMFAPSAWIYTNKVVLLGVERPDLLAICLSVTLRSWIEAYSGAGLGTTLQLSIRESLDTFPAPAREVAQVGIAAAFRFNELAVDWSRENDSGLTGFMNAIHDPENTGNEIGASRALMGEMDAAVAEAYGWHELKAEYAFREDAKLPANDRWRYTVSDEVRAEVLDRLLAENRKATGEANQLRAISL